jgi:TRAP-type mannitol/chloroaromatic compound transport system substrate-binding protein
MVTTWPKNLPGLGAGAERVAQSITALSGERLQVKVFGAGELVGAFESFDAVASGLADMYHSSEITWANRSAAFSYFCNVPLGFTASEINAWVYYGGGQALWDELSASFGLKAFLCGNTGCQMGGWFTKEITSIESYKGLRYRMPGLGGEVLRRLGATVVNVPMGEIILSLQSGAIDASEFAGPWLDMGVGLHKAAKYYYYPGFHEPGAALSLAVNKKLWDGLDSTERSIIETAAAAENCRSLADSTANNAIALELLAKDPAIQIRKFDDAILQSLSKISFEVLAETSRNDDLTRRVYESFIKFRTAAVRWGEISDRAYLNARALPIGG